VPIIECREEKEVVGENIEVRVKGKEGGKDEEKWVVKLASPF
jgi:hypothetical protein